MSLQITRPAKRSFTYRTLYSILHCWNWCMFEYIVLDGITIMYSKTTLTPKPSFTNSTLQCILLLVHWLQSFFNTFMPCLILFPTEGPAAHRTLHTVQHTHTHITYKSLPLELVATFIANLQYDDDHDKNKHGRFHWSPSDKVMIM